MTPLRFVNANIQDTPIFRYTPEFRTTTTLRTLDRVMRDIGIHIHGRYIVQSPSRTEIAIVGRKADGSRVFAVPVAAKAFSGLGLPNGQNHVDDRNADEEPAHMPEQCPVGNLSALARVFCRQAQRVGDLDEAFGSLWTLDCFGRRIRLFR